VGLRGGARDAVEHLGIRQILVSIAHCRSHATAYALALGPTAPPQEEDDEDDDD
jgi:holo-[acyl-carrier protein] synthase